MTGTFPELIPAAAQLPRRALSTAAGDRHSEGLYCLVTPGALPLTALLMLLQASWEGVSVGHPQLSCLVPGQDQNPAPPEQPISISRASPGHHNGGKPSVDARCPPNFPTLRNLDQGGDREVGDKWLGAPGHCLFLAGSPSSSADAAVLRVAGCQGHPGSARPRLGYQWGAPRQLLPGTASAPLLLFKASSTQGKEKKKEREGNHKGDRGKQQ